MVFCLALVVLILAVMSQLQYYWIYATKGQMLRIMVGEGQEKDSDIAKVVLIGNVDIDIYEQDKLKYYYHPDSEDIMHVMQDGPPISFHTAGYYEEQRINEVNYNKAVYTFKITSDEEQTVQIGISNNGKLQEIWDLDLEEGGVFKIEYNPENARVYYKDKQIAFDREEYIR